MKTWWLALGRRAQWSLAAGVAAFVLVLASAGSWLLRPERAVLFSDLGPQDAAMLTAELEKLKLPYELADNGSTLLVDKAKVHATRLKLMGKDLPLHGAVGLELFNNSDFGMTEFAQKINYQRALQGELTRTILALREVQDVRVHLALPEQGLFRQTATKPKAAVTLTLRSGLALRPEQVSGIQRLVAAAVPGLAASEVTIVDQQGVALSRAAGEGEDAVGVRLDVKREMENYLSRKAGVVLERAFGPGQALASVDATIDMEQVRVTTEDVIAAPDARSGGATGVLVRERESAHDNAGPESHGFDARTARGSSMQREVDYQPGRRVEQVVSQPGAIRRLQVVAVLRPALDAQQQEQVRKLVAAAVGASFERGDTVVVQSFAAALPVLANEATPSGASAPVPPEETWPPLAGLSAIALFAIAVVLVLALRRRRRQAPQLLLPLDDEQRQAALGKVRAWLEESPAEEPLVRQGLRPVP